MKPDDIPDDVRLQAVQVVVMLPAMPNAKETEKAIDCVARAILAERERMLAALKDPAAVRVNYLRGQIACQTLIDEAVEAERVRCLEAASQTFAQMEAEPQLEIATLKAALTVIASKTSDRLAAFLAEDALKQTAKPPAISQLTDAEAD